MADFAGHYFVTFVVVTMTIFGAGLLSVSIMDALHRRKNGRPGDGADA